MADAIPNGVEPTEKSDVVMKDEPEQTPDLEGVSAREPPDRSPAVQEDTAVNGSAAALISDGVHPPSTATTTTQTANPPTTNLTSAGRGSQPPAPAPALPPEKPAAHGSSTRLYLNQNITPHLLEGMKQLATEEPEKPLRWLSDYLAKKSAEVEGTC